MDINATYRLICDELESEAPDVDVVREAFTSLDEWMSKGGFLPTPWERDANWNAVTRTYSQ